MRWGMEAAPAVASTMAVAIASTRASRSSSSRTWLSVRISMADELAGPTGSYGHDPVLLPRALHLLGRGHLERPDDHGPRLAGVDDVVDEGAARRDVWVDERAELLDPPRALLVGIGGGRDLLAEDDIGAALGPHDGDLGRGPGHDEVRLIGLAAHDEVPRAIGLADHHGHLGHRGLADRIEHLGAVADDALLLDLGADHEARHVLQEDERDVEGVAQHDEARPCRRHRLRGRPPGPWADWRGCPRIGR